MSEIKKNIETCRGEDVLAEVSAAPSNPHFGSLVNEALDPLKQQALHQAGYDGYSEVIAQHKPYTFASAIIQMKSNLLLLLRALWQFPFGAGTLRSLSDDASLRSLSDDASLRSLSDMWQHYIDRLSGNETYGIPSRLSSLTDLPSAPLLVADRKIVSIGVPDGLGIMQLMTSKPSGITAIGDDMVYDLCYCSQLRNLVAALPSLNEMNIHCKRLTGYDYSYQEWFPSTITKFNGSTDTFEIEELELFEGAAFIGFPTLARNFKIWSFPKMKWSRTSFAHSYNSDDGFVVDWVEQVLAPNCDQLGEYASNVCLCNFTNMWKAVFGNFYVYSYGAGFLRNDPKLIHLEFGAGGVPQSYSLGLGQWSPTNALDASLDTLVTDEDCHNNLEQFLKNFRTYIALRLADNGSGLTLTLSAAVFSSIWDANGNPQVLGDGLDQLRADIHNIVKTTKHWDVNKAN